MTEVVFKSLKRIVQSLTYLPYFVSWVLVVGLMYTLLDPETGVISKMLVSTGIIRSDTMSNCGIVYSSLCLWRIQAAKYLHLKEASLSI
jgi:ABC-type polysaccharide transport system permease subunit